MMSIIGASEAEIGIDCVRIKVAAFDSHVAIKTCYARRRLRRTSQDQPEQDPLDRRDAVAEGIAMTAPPSF